MEVAWLPLFSVAALLAVVVFYLAAGAMDVYSSGWRSVSMPREALTVLHAWGWVVVVLLVLAYATKTSSVFSRRTITLWLILAPTLVIGWRVLLRMLQMHFRTLRGRVKRVVIAGGGQLGRQLADSLRVHPELGLVVDAFYDDALPVGQAPGADSDARVRGGLEQMISDARAAQFDEIYLALPMHAEARIREVLSGLADTSIPTYLVPDLFAFTLLHAQMADIAGTPVVSVYGSPHQGMGGVVKRLEDIILGTLILCLMAVPMVLIALGVKLTSRGPVFYKQRRYGLSGEPVLVWKFRTMSVCEDDDEVVQVSRHDPRVTRFGAFLRRLSLDEFPQFFNVLKGDLSIVGPRPHAVTHNEQYRKVIPGYMLRHIVKPGITGWAQVNGWRGETRTVEQMEKRVEYDLEYIRSWSLWLDLKIIFLTIFRVFSETRAY
jgi:putative colanic acid biosynthesis UDP-glucose lipid carrier transferase